MIKEPVFFSKDTNTENLRQCNKCCRSLGLDRGPLAWESAALTPSPSGLNIFLTDADCSS